MKRLKEIFRIINISQIIDFIFFPIILLISLICKPFCKNIWLVEENSNEACDNGYIFFKYLRKERKDINVYYVINKKSKDYNKVKSLGNVIQHRSLKHWIYYLNAKKIIVTQKYANPSPALFYILHTRNILKIPRIYLQHGLIKDDAKMFYYNRTKFKLYTCGALREYKYVKEKFGYPDDSVVYTGLARFDNLVLNNEINNYILIAPTWRNYINKQNDFDTYIKKYYDILSNKELVNLIEKKNIIIQVVLHKNMNKFKINCNFKSKNIKINHNHEVDIQDILNKADLLITDYSSIFFDIAYRKRGIIYYQFDYEMFRKNQLQVGYFSFENDSFGDVFDNCYDVIEKIKYYINNNFKIEDKYEKRMTDFFERKDKNNSKRILEAIERIK